MILTMNSGSSHNALRVFATTNITEDLNKSSMPISTIEPFSSNMLSSSHNRATPVTATAFHPHRMMLACSVLGEGHVSLFKCVGQDGRPAEEKPRTPGIVREWDA